MRSIGFVFMLTLALAITLLVAPTYASYNQVLLIPGSLLLIKERRAIWQHSLASRFMVVCVTASGFLALVRK